MELFEEIRREYEQRGGSIHKIAKKFGVHRRVVRQAIKNAIPPERKKSPRPKPKLAFFQSFIDEILIGDKRNPRKQRHTAHRIWDRILAEQPEKSISESTVRTYVRWKKDQLGLSRHETFVPQSYSPGVEAQIDWYEAVADLDGERITLQVFCMRSMYSGAAFHRAYTNATQQAFLEAHEHGFRYFGGIFARLRYDNLSSAVKKILRGYRREETTRFISFRSHWGFESEFCTPARGNEKGGVESENGYFRRNHWVPVPVAADLESLNTALLAACRADEARVIGDRQQSVGFLMTMDRDSLRALPEESYDVAQDMLCDVNKHGCVVILTNWYSAPLRAATTAHVVIHADFVEIRHQGSCVARHPRSYGRQQKILSLEHYLDVLERKPGALAGSTPLQQRRDQGKWPKSYDELWQSLNKRHGRSGGTRQMIELLQLGKKHGFDSLQKAVENSLQLGCMDVAAIRHLLIQDQLPKSEHPALENIGPLSRFERPLPDLKEFDLLLKKEIH